VVRQPHPTTGKMVLFATPLLVALIVINVADLIFAVDSVPAIFLITTDTFIVYTANIMAILGLRALYFALAALVHRFHYLKYALAVVLIFIGMKGFYSYFFGKFDPYLSLGITLSIIGAGIAYSLWKTRGDGGGGIRPSARRSRFSNHDCKRRHHRVPPFSLANQAGKNMVNDP
jgi:tellurite resistance protein TerC